MLVSQFTLHPIHRHIDSLSVLHTNYNEHRPYLEHPILAFVIPPAPIARFQELHSNN